MARVSIDNGHTFCTAEEAMGKPHFVGWRFFVEMMDDETREAVHREGIEEGPDWEMRFLKRYLELAKEDLIIG